MNSRTLTIAREDFRRALRSRLLWGTFTLISLLMIPTFWQSLRGGTFTVREKITYIPYDFRMYVVILVAVVTYNAIVSEREKGTIRLLIGLPGTRRDVILGKLISRVSLVLITLVPILFILDVILAVKYGTLYLDTYLPIAFWIIAYGVLWSGFTVGLSAMFSSRYRTLAALTCTYLFFSSMVDIWSTLVLPVFSFLFTGTFSTRWYSSLGTGTEPLWVGFTGRLNPISAFLAGSEWIVSLTTSTISTTHLLPNLFGIMVLAFFGGGPLIVGYWRFCQVDLT
ncbi:ABC transporter permease [Halorussus salilacus]|uniref:ABC transporter permease n=1 Tax=Halorussus salilacus TaxID=2953750 RepID=UPI0020A0E246|nr:ABC transporter permease subunit [Halorussus salilacus]USZ66739.1 ABC transporter permease [Halorussus salilacus]